MIASVAIAMDAKVFSVSVLFHFNFSSWQHPVDNTEEKTPPLTFSTDTHTVTLKQPKNYCKVGLFVT